MKLKSPPIFFGVEIEAPMLIYARDTNGKPKEKSTEVLASWSQAVRIIANELIEEGLDAYASPLDEEQIHTKWRATIDASIVTPWLGSTDNRSVAIPVEIKSPIQRLTPDAVQQFRKVWKVITPHMAKKVELYLMSSTHIHLSCGPGLPVPIAAAQKLAFCVIYFEKSMDKYLPTNTLKGDRIIRPGGGGAPLVALRDCWKAIRETTSTDELARLVCYDKGRDSRVHKVPLKTFKWNFYGLGLNTIEFRHMPPSRCLQDTLDWIKIAMGFVLASWQVDSEALNKACNGDLTFTEALGAIMTDGDIRKLRAQEEVWAADGIDDILGPNFVATWMKSYVRVDDSVFRRRIDACRSWEKELAASNEQPEETDHPDPPEQPNRSGPAEQLEHELSEQLEREVAELAALADLPDLPGLPEQPEERAMREEPERERAELAKLAEPEQPENPEQFGQPGEPGQCAQPEQSEQSEKPDPVVLTSLTALNELNTMSKMVKKLDLDGLSEMVEKFSATLAALTAQAELNRVSEMVKRLDPDGLREMGKQLKEVGLFEPPALPKPYELSERFDRPENPKLVILDIVGELVEMVVQLEQARLPEQPELPEKPEEPEQSERSEQSEQPEQPEQPEKPEKPEQPEQSQKPQKPEVAKKLKLLERLKQLTFLKKPEVPKKPERLKLFKIPKQFKLPKKAEQSDLPKLPKLAEQPEQPKPEPQS